MPLPARRIETKHDLLAVEDCGACIGVSGVSISALERQVARRLVGEQHRDLAQSGGTLAWTCPCAASA
jgi:hypothetical protein